MLEDLNILPLLFEECYLKANPSERKSRAFLEFCQEGDLEAAVDLLKANDEEFDDGEDGSNQTTELLLYQDPIGGMQSALHIAVKENNLELVWLLLFLASTLDLQWFPSEVYEAAMRSGVFREANLRMDIRSLRDSEGRTAADIATEYITSNIDPLNLTTGGRR